MGELKNRFYNRGVSWNINGLYRDVLSPVCVITPFKFDEVCFKSFGVYLSLFIRVTPCTVRFVTEYQSLNVKRQLKMSYKSSAWARWATYHFLKSVGVVTYRSRTSPFGNTLKEIQHIFVSAYLELLIKDSCVLTSCNLLRQYWRSFDLSCPDIDHWILVPSFLFRSILIAFYRHVWRPSPERTRFKKRTPVPR